MKPNPNYCADCGTTLAKRHPLTVRCNPCAMDKDMMSKRKRRELRRLKEKERNA